ncbi:MAG TPA: methylated-DNA--[protein]-cysteine S-methyltransferase [Verrucomicrobiae bacterium]
MTSHQIQTSLGTFKATFSERGLASLDFPRSGTSNAAESKNSSPAIELWKKNVATAIDQLAKGRVLTTLPPLDLTNGTEFQRSVWGALKRVRHGATKTYAEIAREIGKPRATRAVGTACGANPIPIFIPCHRVLPKGGGLGGFSGGLDWKKKLLELEASAR